MFALIVSYTAIIPYTGFHPVWISLYGVIYTLICTALTKGRLSNVFGLEFGQFNRKVSVNANQTINRTSFNYRPKGSVDPALNIGPTFSVSSFFYTRYKDSKPGNSLIREITRAPPGKSSQHFVSYLYKGLSNRIISQLRIKAFLLSHHNFSRY